MTLTPARAKRAASAVPCVPVPPMIASFMIFLDPYSERAG
jgi:hypothetical protein